MVEPSDVVTRHRGISEMTPETACIVHWSTSFNYWIMNSKRQRHTATPTSINRLSTCWQPPAWPAPTLRVPVLDRQRKKNNDDHRSTRGRTTDNVTDSAKKRVRFYYYSAWEDFFQEPDRFSPPTLFIFVRVFFLLLVRLYLIYLFFQALRFFSKNGRWDTVEVHICFSCHEFPAFKKCGTRIYCCLVEITSNIGCPLSWALKIVIIPQKFYLQGAQINRKNVLFTLAFTVSYFLRELANYEKID